jgi:hypothetical protein
MVATRNAVLPSHFEVNTSLYVLHLISRYGFGILLGGQHYTTQRHTTPGACPAVSTFGCGRGAR